jgi:hypothetical protein
MRQEIHDFSKPQKGLHQTKNAHILMIFSNNHSALFSSKAAVEQPLIS